MRTVCSLVPIIAEENLVMDKADTGNTRKRERIGAKELETGEQWGEDETVDRKRGALVWILRISQ